MAGRQAKRQINPLDEEKLFRPCYLTRMFTAIEFILWAREQQKAEPGNLLHMVGEMDYASEIQDVLEEWRNERSTTQ